jgi:glycosyltransferase 2 family protein
MARWVVRAAVSVALAAILLRLIPLGAVIVAIRRTNPAIWIASLGVFIAGHYLNAVKLRLLIGVDAVATTTCVRAQYAGLVANLGLPGLAGGDVARAAYLAPIAGTRRVLVASISDRVVDSVVLVVLVALALPLAGVPPAIAAVLRAGRWWSAVALLALALAAVVVVAMRRKNPAGRVSEIWQAAASHRSAVARAAAISLVVQSSFVLTNIWLAHSVGVAVGLAPWFVAWPLSKLIAVLPISLGGIGVREAALVSLLSPYGAARESVLATAVLWQAVLTLSGLGGLVVTQAWRRPATPRAAPGVARAGEPR